MGFIRDQPSEADLSRRGWGVDFCDGDGRGCGSPVLREAVYNPAEEEGGEEHI